MQNINKVVDFVLKMPKNGRFSILQLSDIQIIDASQMRTPCRLSAGEATKWAKDSIEKNCFSVMRQVINKVKPNLIVLDGDNVYGEFDDSGTSLIRLISEMESYKIPWALTLGNHDNECAKGIDWICAQYSSAKHCLFKKGEVTGNSNYTIGLERGNELKEIIFLMDSNGCDNTFDSAVTKIPGYYDDQIAWFNSVCANAKKYNNNITVPNIGFSHIPIRALGEAFYNKTDFQSNAIRFIRYSGSTPLPSDFQPVKISNIQGEGFGEIRRDFGMLDESGIFYSSMVKNGTQGWYFGHEHKNNGSIKTDDGIRLTFGLKTGYYDSYSPDAIGGTKIVLGEDYSTTHIYYTQN